MGLSNYALETMGFDKIPKGNPIEARFHSLNLYEVRGITATCESVLNPEVLRRSTPHVAATIGCSPNSVCQVLTGDDFTDNEEEWLKEKKTTPPYMMVLTSLPNSTICESGYWKNESGKIITHDCFTSSKEELVQLEKEKTTSFVTALTATLSTPENSVSFIPISRIVYGITPDKLTIHDVRFTASAEIYVSKAFSMEEVISGVEAALTASDKIHSKVGFFFDLAVRESDPLKKFLYYFLVIEVHTHQVFKGLDYPSSFSDVNNVPERIESEATNLLLNYQKDAKNLTHRFIWCSLLAWKDITDKDITQFKDIKKLRDRIYHGEDVDMKALPFNQAKKLAIKIIKGEFCR